LLTISLQDCVKANKCKCTNRSLKKPYSLLMGTTQGVFHSIESLEVLKIGAFLKIWLTVTIVQWLKTHNGAWCAQGKRHYTGLGEVMSSNTQDTDETQAKNKTTVKPLYLELW